MKQILCTAGIAGALLTAGLRAQGSFTDLGVGIRPDSISDDGRLIGGDDGTGLAGSRTFLLSFVPSPLPGWPGQYAYINQYPSGSYISGNIAISADGSRAARNIDDGSGVQVAGRWDAFAQTWFSIGFLPLALQCPSMSAAYDISDDGSVIVGLSWDGCRGRAFRWTLPTGMVELSHIGSSARASAVSGDGQIVGGFDHHPQFGSRRASVWFPDARGQQIILEGRPEGPEGFGEVWQLNRDGSVIVGWGFGDAGGYAFRWRNGVVTNLGINGSDPHARASTEDGSMIVGEGGNIQPGPGEQPVFAWIWTQEDGAVGIEPFLAQQGVTVTPGSPLTFMTDMTPDGKTIVGMRGFPFNPTMPLSGFVIELPDWRKYGMNAAPANTLALDGSGTGRLGQTFVATTSNLPAPIALTIISGRTSPPLPFLGGALLVDLLGPTLIVQAAPVTGTTAAVSVNIPNRPALVGASLAFQSLTIDPSAPAGWAFSNGLKLTIRN